MNTAFEPWYESSGPSSKYVTESLFTCLKYKIENHTLLNLIIDEVIKSTKDFGSYRGYHTFLHAKFKADVIERYEYKTNKKLHTVK